jgi:hypothetical protein
MRRSCATKGRRAAHAQFLSKGAGVKGNTALAVGTAIATFDAGGHYPNNAHGNHAAIYLGQDAQGIRVVDQWVDRHGIHRSPAIRVLKFDDTKGASDNGNKFNVVE